ncbi:MAG: Rrf2 family transcriptional regulator [Bacteroidetes bacterium]|nr:Rrf2 family transcriptional regulator [Bacteroidota bacterium]
MFSKSCEYAIRATIYIAKQTKQDKRVGIKDIANAINSPNAFTGKILQQLSKAKIIESAKGPSGGFSINNKKLLNLKLSEIVTAIDGDSIYKGCGLGFKECSEKKPCPVHNKFKIVRNELKNMLENTKINELSDNLEKGLAFLQR